MRNQNLIVVPRAKLPSAINLVKMGLEVASGAKSKRTYYNSKEKQVAAIQNAVSDLYQFDKSFPVVLAAMKDSTHYFRSVVLLNELKSGTNAGNVCLIESNKWFDEYQDGALWFVLSQMPITYTLRLFVDLANNRVSNARTRRIMLTYIWSLNEFAFVKYRTKIERILRHAYGVKKWSALVSQAKTINSNVLTHHQVAFWDENINKYNFELIASDVFNFVNFVARNYNAIPKASLDSESFIKSYLTLKSTGSSTVFWKHAKRLDKTVVEGIVSSHSNPLYAGFFTEVEGKKTLTDSFKSKLLASSKTLTDESAVRLTKTFDKLGIDKREIRVENVSSEALMMTGYETGNKLREEISKKANLDKIDLPYTNIGIVVDKSLSNRGAEGSKNSPRAAIEYMVEVLKASADCRSLAATQMASVTDLVSPFIEVMSDHYRNEACGRLDAVIVLSDGYENHPYEGALSHAIKVGQKADDEFPQIIHINPLVAAEMGALGRTLGDNIATMVANKPGQLRAQFNASTLELNPRKYLAKLYAPLMVNEEPVETV